MRKREKNLWDGLNQAARKTLTGRSYKQSSFTQRVVGTGVDAGELVAANRARPEVKKIWIPGVEIFPRNVHAQRRRGLFGELVRQEQGKLAEIGLWPKQWAAARMYAHSAKGFHVHPPSIPADTTAEKWHRRLFVDRAKDFSLRQYDREQWDAMFFLQGRAEMILRDVRAGLPARTMHLFIDGDDHRSANNIGIVIPPGVAHAVRVEGSEDVIMVYGTSTVFHPEFEGRIASEVETTALPESWRKFLGESA